MTPGTETTNQLVTEIQAFEALRGELEKNHMGKFVVFKDNDFIGAWDTLDESSPFLVETLRDS